MARERRFETERELAGALEALAPRLRFPDTPDLTPAVRARIVGHVPTPMRPRRPVGGRFAALAAALIALVFALTLAFPAGRDTVASWLDLPGVTLYAEDPAEQPILGGELQLGTRVTLDEARERAAFDVLLPDHDLLGEPDEVYFDRRPVGGAVSFVYHADDDLPSTEETGVGLLLTQVRGELNPGMFGKGVPEGVELDVLEVNGATAYWFSGEPHPFFYTDPEGETIYETRRLAGNTLIWQDDGLTLRLESALERETIVAIAESMR